MSCLNLLEEETPRTFSDLNSLRSAYIQRLNSREKISSSEINSPLRKIAFFEAMGEVAGIDFLKSKNEKLLGEFEDLVANINLSEVQRESQLVDFFVKLYLISNGWNSGMKKYLGPFSGKVLRDRIISALRAKDATLHFLSDTGIVKDTRWQSFIIQSTRGWPALAASLAGSFVTYFLFQFPGPMAPTQLTNSLTLADLKNPNLKRTKWYPRLDIIARQVNILLLVALSATRVIDFELPAALETEKIVQEAKTTAAVVDLAGGALLAKAQGRYETTPEDISKLMEDRAYGPWANVFESNNHRPPDLLNNRLDFLQALSDINEFYRSRGTP